MQFLKEMLCFSSFQITLQVPPPFSSEHLVVKKGWVSFLIDKKRFYLKPQNTQVREWPSPSLHQAGHHVVQLQQPVASCLLHHSLGSHVAGSKSREDAGTWQAIWLGVTG